MNNSSILLKTKYRRIGEAWLCQITKNTFREEAVVLSCLTTLSAPGL